MWCLQPAYGVSCVACRVPKKERAFWQISGLPFRTVEELIISWVLEKKLHMRYGNGEGEQVEELGGCACFLQINRLMVLCLQDGCIPVQTIPWEVVTGTISCPFRTEESSRYETIEKKSVSA